MESDIKLFFHCKKCVEENDKKDKSMRDYSSIECGWTVKGLQIWCKRHETNIINLDFEGHTLKAR